MPDEAKTPRNTNGAIAKAATAKAAAKSETATLQQFIVKMTPEIARALPKHINPDRITRIALTAIRTNPQLARCTPESFMGALLQGAQLGLEVNSPLGEAYLIPYNNTRERRMEAQFQLGYKGLVSLAYRSGQVVSIHAHEVYENDEFEFEFGLHPDLKHVPAKHNRGSVIAYYAVINLKDGGSLFEVMSREDIELHAKKYSKANNSPWNSGFFDQMALKTVLKRALRYAPLSADLMRSVAADETIKTEISPDMTEIAGSYIIDEGTGEVVADAESTVSDG